MWTEFSYFGKNFTTWQKEKKRGEATSSLQRIFGGKNPLNWPQIEKKRELVIAIFRLEVLANYQNIARFFFLKLLFSLKCSRIWLNPSCGELAIHLPHEIEKENPGCGNCWSNYKEPSESTTIILFKSWTQKQNCNWTAKKFLSGFVFASHCGTFSAFGNEQERCFGCLQAFGGVSYLQKITISLCFFVLGAADCCWQERQAESTASVCKSQ